MDSGALARSGERLMDYALEQVPRVLVALFILALGWRVIRLFVELFVRTAKKRDLDPTLIPFLKTVLAWTLRAALLISVASTMGLPMASFLAVLGSAGLALGLALQGSLSNLASGVMILTFRPYKIGDLIEAQGCIGIVKEIQVFTTTLVNADKKRIIIPNGRMFSGVIINYNAEGIRRIDVIVGVSYDADVELARTVLMRWMKEHPLVIEEPAPSVEIVGFAESSVQLAVRPFCLSQDYWRVFFDTHEISKQRLEAEGIRIPLPQRQLHIVENGRRGQDQTDAPVAEELSQQSAE